MKVDLSYILNNECFRTCNFLTASSLVSYCKERGIDISERVLERFEELALLFPIARAKEFPYPCKIRMTDDGRGYERLGPLEDGEEWLGETRTEYSRFYFGRTGAHEWLSDGYLWDPKSRPFVPWKSYRDADGSMRVESYYSHFQAYEIWFRLKSMRRLISAESWISDPSGWAHFVSDWAAEELNFAKNHYLRYEIPLLCQVISNRYYPLTQTNQRYFKLSVSSRWDWREFSRRWDAQAVLNQLQLESNDIRKMWEMMVLSGKDVDPLEDWYDLVSYVSVEKRERLKGSALCAQTWYTMEHMIRQFYSDLTGENLPTPEGPVTDKFWPGAEARKELLPLTKLEQLANDYNINPRPNLILVVEGQSEAEIFPSTIESLFGSSVQSLGIEIMPLKGIGNFTGKKQHDPYGALSRFIDYYHSRGTIVFIVLDCEGRARQVRDQLLEAKSIHQERYVTRAEYVQLWKTNIELDNFSDQEIADALSNAADGRATFTADEIHRVRQSFGESKKVTLGNLFQEKTGRDLDKPAVLSSLVKLVRGDKWDVDDARPIIPIIREVIRLANENYAMSHSHREGLKTGGLFGRLLRGSE